MPVDDLSRLRHMLESTVEAVSYIEGRTRGDLNRVWDTVVDDLPPLIISLRKALEA